MKKSKEPLNILFTSQGRRVELIKIFQESFPEGTHFYGADFNETSPASYFLDKVFKVPFKIDEKYIENILKICIENHIDIVIPLIDPELPLFAEYKKIFSKHKIFVMVSDYNKIKIANDKWVTFNFLKDNNIPTPITILPSKIENSDKLNYPIIAKPRRGSASKGIYKIYNKKEFENLKLDDSYIIQDYIKGDEITVDIFSDESGKCYEAVQRKRLKIRGGEVERGVTIKNSKILDISKKFVGIYKPLGIINIQFILTKDYPYLIEINPRFGGGYPLSYQAGANYPKMLLKLYQGNKNRESLGSYIKNLYVLRYDNAIYTNELIKLC